MAKKGMNTRVWDLPVFQAVQATLLHVGCWSCNGVLGEASGLGASFRVEQYRELG